MMESIEGKRGRTDVYVQLYFPMRPKKNTSKDPSVTATHQGRVDETMGPLRPDRPGNAPKYRIHIPWKAPSYNTQHRVGRLAGYKDGGKE